MVAKNSAVDSPDPAYAARKKNLELALQQIAKDYGEGAIMRLGDDHIAPVEVIPTGNILIDRALGVGGFPRGRIVEVFGPESNVSCSGNVKKMRQIIQPNPILFAKS